MDPYLGPHLGLHLNPYLGPHLEVPLDPYLQPHLGPHLDPYLETQLDPHPDPHPEPHLDPYLEPHLEPHLGPHLGPHLDPYLEPHLGLHLNPYLGPHLGPHLEVPLDPYLQPHLGPHLGPHPAPPLPAVEEEAPDLECAVCFSQFNNVFRTPKMLQCGHTFCLECLARMNVKSAQPNSIQCPLCRGFTPLPDLGLPKLATDPAVLSYLPAAMQRVYSIRFNRSKGKLQVKRSSEVPVSLRTVRHSLDVGLPNPPAGLRAAEEARRARGASVLLLRLSNRPACRAFLFTSVVMMMVLLSGIIIFLLVFRQK